MCVAYQAVIDSLILPVRNTTHIEDFLLIISYLQQKSSEIQTKRTATDTADTPQKSKKRRKRQESNKEEEEKSTFTPTTSSVKFSDIGGCEDTIEQVCKMLVHMRHPEVFSTLGIIPPRGFLLHGPPGCGKTLLAHAIAGVSSI